MKPGDYVALREMVYGFETGTVGVVSRLLPRDDMYDVVVCIIDRDYRQELPFEESEIRLLTDVEILAAKLGGKL